MKKSTAKDVVTTGAWKGYSRRKVIRLAKSYTSESFKYRFSRENEKGYCEFKEQPFLLYATGYLNHEGPKWAVSGIKPSYLFGRKG